MLSQSGVHLVGALNPLSSTSVLASLGALGVFLVLFAETGLLIGFFLPGDSLLFTAGLLCTTTRLDAVHLSLPQVILAAIAGALLGAQTATTSARRAGRCSATAATGSCAQGTERAGHLLERYGYGQGHRPGPVHPGSADRAQPDGRRAAGAAPHLHPVAGRRRRDLGGRRHPGRLRAGLARSPTSTRTCCRSSR